MEKLILIALIFITYIPICMMFVISFMPEWRKVEAEYSMLKRKWLVASRIVALAGLIAIMAWLAVAVRDGCKECEQYEQITTPVYKKI